MTGTLYIVATPIGNLSDTSPRVLETLRAVDVILAEDTRVILKLLSHFGIQKKLYSYSEHASDAKNCVIVNELLRGVNYALVSDAGTPAVSDPGAVLVELALKNDCPVVPIPGPSAVTALVSAFGKRETAFHFWGFFPQKTKKQKQIVIWVETIPGIHVFFESPFRIIKTLEKYFVPHEDFHMVVGREMTKQFETFYRGRPALVVEQIKAGVVKGEFCVGVICNTNGA